MIVTGDGSVTLYSDVYNEHYHSMTGAYEEALHKFVYPSNVLELSLHREVRILDICFGLGYNSLVTLEMAINSYPIHITAIEMDYHLIHKIKSIEYKNPSWSEVCFETYKNKISFYRNGKIELLIGDARDVVKNLESTYDIIYLDPFSTLKNTELWTYDFFKLLKSKLFTHGLIVTYSSALPVRSGLLRNGYNVYTTQPIGRRRGGTLASLKPYSDGIELSLKDKYLLEYSDGKLPYRDKSLNGNCLDILSRRKSLVQYLIQKNKIKKVKDCYRDMASI